MPVNFSFGTNTQLSLASKGAPKWQLAEVPHGEPLIDPQAATRAAIRSPIDFPSLSQAIVPDDQIAIALEPGVVEAGAVVAGVVHELIEAGAELDSITVVCTAGEAQDPRHRLPAMLRGRVQLERHDPTNRDKLEFLAANRKGRTIYLNRTICDAGLLVTVGHAHHGRDYEDLGVHTGLFPTFSDVDSMKRYRNPALVDQFRSDSPSAMLKLARFEVAKLGWIAGAVFTVQVVPAGHDRVMDVLAGEPERVERELRRRNTMAWCTDPAQTGDLVIAAISGGESQQTWSNLVRALLAALDRIDDDGAVALCTELAVEPGEGMRHIRRQVRPERLEAWIHEHRPADSLDALMLIRALQQAKVFLLSKLPADVTEPMGFETLESPDEVTRLMQRYQRPLLLPHAQFVLGTPR
jgi:hypothetical protein